MRVSKVAILDIDLEGGKEAANEINLQGGEAVFLACDVSKDEDCRKAFEQAVDKFGRLDFLVNAAGIAIRASVLETSEADWDKTIRLTSSRSTCSANIQFHYMTKSGGGD